MVRYSLAELRMDERTPAGAGRLTEEAGVDIGTQKAA
jgi:hypothetical protein